MTGIEREMKGKKRPKERTKKQENMQWKEQ